MNATDLTKAFALNREIASLSAIGLPIDIGIQPGSSIDTELDRINSYLSRRIANGDTMNEVICNAPELPAQYRASLWAWIHHSDPTIALNRLSSPAQTKHDFKRYISNAFVYPGLLICLAYLGLLSLCLFTGPAFDSFFASVVGSTDSIRWLQRIQMSIWIWAPVFPAIMLALLIGWRLLCQYSSWNWIPGSRQYYEAFANAELARQLAFLIEDGQSIEEAMSLLRSDHITPDPQQIAVENLPALLRWAVSVDLGQQSLIACLHLAAESYRQTAERQRGFWQFAMPTLCTAILGGTIALAYGLALFLPLVELLYSVANGGAN